jgi:hypothetical protein
MSYTVPCSTIGALSTVLSCFDSMNQLVSLDIVSGGLQIQSVDHDATTVLTYTLPMEATGGYYTDNVKVYVKCEQVLHYIDRAHGNVNIEVSGGSWSLRDTTGQACVWSTVTKQPLPNTPSICVDHHDCMISMPSTDFLLYVQHITLCENYVRVSSHGMNDVTLESEGELISIQIQNQSIVQTGRVYSLLCTFKYIRAILPLIQKTEILNVCITHGNNLFFNIDVFPGTLCIVLKDMTPH